MIEGGRKPSRQPLAPVGPRAVFPAGASAPRRRDDGNTASPAMRPHGPAPNFMPFFEMPLMAQKFLHHRTLLHFPSLDVGLQVSHDERPSFIGLSKVFHFEILLLLGFLKWPSGEMPAR
jgi:hypothetical protein